MVWVRNASLRRKLPLLVSGLTGGSLVVAGVLAYLEVRQAALAAAGARLESIVAEIATVSAGAQAERSRLERDVAGSPYVIAAIEGWMIDTLQLTQLFDSLRNGGEYGMPVSLVRPDGSVAFQHGTLEAPGDAELEPPLRAERTYGPFRQVDGRVVYWLTIPVTGATPEPIGWIAQRRSVGAVQGASVGALLLEDEIRVLIGIPTDPMWIDLGGNVVETSPRDLRLGAPYRIETPTGVEVLASAGTLPEGPWIVQADMPMSQVLSRPRAFRNAALGVGALLTLVAVLIAWMTSGRLTRPLGALVAATDAMAAGEYSRRVEPTGEDDELGRLASTFNTMAEHVARADEALRLQLEEMRALAMRLEEANVAAEKARVEAQEASRVKSEFLATMSHEIRTPINVVLSYVDLLKAGVPDQPTKRQRDYLRRIDQSSQLLLWLLNDLLDFSRIESEEMHIELIEGSAREVIQVAVSALEPSALQKDVFLTSRSCDAEFLGDEQRVRQIVLNLLSNAIKFTPPGGSVIVSCSPTDDGPPEASLKTGPWVRIDVRDTGVGIEPDQLSRIFEPFVRGNAERIGGSGGAGLGLAISRRLASMMSGTITVKSVPGAGSLFTLWLRGAPAEHVADVLAEHRGGVTEVREVSDLPG